MDGWEKNPIEDQVIVFEKQGVFIHVYLPNDGTDEIIAGVLRILEKKTQKFVSWEPNQNAIIKETPGGAPDAQVLGRETSSVVGGNEEMLTEVQDIGIERSRNISDPEWTLVDESNKVCENESDSVLDELTDIPLKFDFIVSIQELDKIKKSSKGGSWQYLSIILADGSVLPALHFHQGGSKKFLKVLEQYVFLTNSPKENRTLNVTFHNHDAMTQSFDELNLFGENRKPETQAAKFLENPMNSAFSGFSKVTNFLQDMLNPTEVAATTSRPQSKRVTLDFETSDSAAAKRIQTKTDDESVGGFEVITCAQLGPRLNPPRNAPITTEFWKSFQDDMGCFHDVDKLKMAIFKSGIESSLRKEAWKYLLDYYQWEMPKSDLVEYRRLKEEDYYKMKLQWKSVSVDQESRFSVLRDNKSLIDKDVNRTDRTRIFYEGQENLSLKLLNDVLMTYCMYNFDLGYVQGMSDLLSPILEIMGNEVDSFWCFVGYMHMVKNNFSMSQHGMKQQLQQLRQLIQYLDPELFEHLEEKESSNLYFCFRWLLVRFKREFSFEDIQTLWEVTWTNLPCKNFHLIICLALLDTEKRSLMSPECGFTEILKHINELSLKIDTETTLRKAEGIYLQLNECRNDLPHHIKEILGL